MEKFIMTFLDDCFVQIACLIGFSVAALYLLRRWIIATTTTTTKEFLDGRIRDEVVFITGCDSGIGFQLARFFDRLGFEVYAGCLRPDSSEAEDLRGQASSRLHVVDLDITDAVKVARAYELLNTKLGDKGLWCLINNAGVLCYGEFEWLTWDQCMKQLEVNLVATVRVTKAFLPLVIKRKGRIVTVTSVNGLLSYPLQAVYCATKFALEGFCDSLRLEMRRHGVHVATVQLGDFARLTNILANHLADARTQREAMTSDVRQRDGDYFDAIQNIISLNAGMTSPPSYEKSRLFSDFKHAVVAPKPKNRYLCMSTMQRCFFTLLLSLPRSISDALIAFVFRKMTSDN